MVRLAALAIVLSLSGLPLVGGVLCGFVCAPVAAQQTGCHDHGANQGAAAVSSAHACDHGAAATPAVLQPAPAGVSVQTAGPIPPASAILLTAGSVRQTWEPSPNARVVVLPPQTSVLRI